MQVFVELLLFRVEEAELAARLAEAIERCPEEARDAVFLLGGAPGVEPLSLAFLFTRDDQPGQVTSPLKRSPSAPTERVLTWQATPRVEVGEIEVSLEMKQSQGAESAWSGQMSLDDAFTAIVLEPGLLLVASPTLVPDEEVAAFRNVWLERMRRLDSLAKRERAVQRAVDALLEPPAPRQALPQGEH